MTEQRSLLIDEHPLQVLPELAKAIGLNEAIILQQVHYWLNRSTNVQDGRRFVYRTQAGWVAEFPFWSVATIKRALWSLRERGLLLLSKREEGSWDRTNWYSINYDALNSLNFGIGSNCTNALDQVAPMHKVKVSQSTGADCANPLDQSEPMRVLGTETTTETTSKRRARARAGVPIPADFAISDQIRGWARRKKFEPYLEAHFEYFVTYARNGHDGKVPLYLDWEGAFRNSILGDWGGVRKNMRMDQQYGPQVATAPAVICAYDDESPGKPCGMPNAEPFERYGNKPVCTHHRQKIIERTSSTKMPDDVRRALKLPVRRTAGAP